MGVVILSAIALYLIVSLVVVILAARAAKKRGKSLWRWGGAAALVMYLLVFWDHIPTVVAHKYYCEKEAGFWVYKTVEQWKRENTGVIETLPLPSYSGSPTKYEQFDDGRGKTNTYLLNERFNWIVSQQDISSLFPIIRTEQQFKDVKKNEVLARYVDFSTGNSVKSTIGPPGPLKFWMSSTHCRGGGNNQDALRKVRDDFRGGTK
jgi:hypothetical protein